MAPLKKLFASLPSPQTCNDKTLLPAGLALKQYNCTGPDWSVKINGIRFAPWSAIIKMIILVLYGLSQTALNDFFILQIPPHIADRRQDRNQDLYQLAMHLARYQSKTDW